MHTRKSEDMYLPTGAIPTDAFCHNHLSNLSLSLCCKKTFNSLSPPHVATLSLHSVFFTVLSIVCSPSLASALCQTRPPILQQETINNCETTTLDNMEFESLGQCWGSMPPCCVREALTKSARFHQQPPHGSFVVVVVLASG